MPCRRCKQLRLLIDVLVTTTTKRHRWRALEMQERKDAAEISISSRRDSRRMRAMTMAHSLMMKRFERYYADAGSMPAVVAFHDDTFAMSSFGMSARAPFRRAC